MVSTIILLAVVVNLCFVLSYLGRVPIIESSGTVHRFSSSTSQGLDGVRRYYRKRRQFFFLSLRNSIVLHSYAPVASGGRNQGVMAGAHECSSSGLDKGRNGVGQFTHFLSATRSLLIGSFQNSRNLFRFRNRELQNDATSSSTGEHTYYSTAPLELWTEPLSKDLQDATTISTGEHTYYSTAPQELWTELLSEDLQDLNFLSMTQNSEGESSFLEVQEMRQSDFLLQQFLAEGGQANVYFAECEKFSTPVVVKRLKHRHVNLYELLCRMEKLMKIRKDNNSAICRVFGAGKDFVGNVWVVMERMAGDLRTLIDSRIEYLEDGQMPFDYNNTITMMLHIAQGMEDLHRCDLIHADLKASNILVTPVILSPTLTYFYVKIGDFETSNGVVGTRFWRAPEVMQALENGVKPILSPAADVYSYGMLCYELLTGRIPFEGCGCTNKVQILNILSGQRPELPAYVNLTMKELLHACWHTEPRERPGWMLIIKTLKEELMFHPPGSQQPKRRAQPWEQSGRKSIIKTLKVGLRLRPPGSQGPKRRAESRIEMEREETQDAATTSETSNLVVISWEEAAAQELGTEAFATWKAKIASEIEPILMVILERRKALTQDTYNNIMHDFEIRVSKAGTYATFNEVLWAFEEAWHLVEETWTNHVGRGLRSWESGIDLTNGSEMETLEEGEIVAKRETENTAWENWPNEALESYNLLGPTAERWLKEILATSEEWQAFRTILSASHSKNEGLLHVWEDELNRASYAWEDVYVAFHACHVESPIVFIAWQLLKNKEYSMCRENTKYKVLLDTMLAEVYLKVYNEPELEAAMGSIKTWKVVEVERVTIRRLFLQNTIGLLMIPRTFDCR